MYRFVTHINSATIGNSGLSARCVGWEIRSTEKKNHDYEDNHHISHNIASSLQSIPLPQFSLTKRSQAAIIVMKCHSVVRRKDSFDRFCIKGKRFALRMAHSNYATDINRITFQMLQLITNLALFKHVGEFVQNCMRSCTRFQLNIRCLARYNLKQKQSRQSKYGNF